MKNLGSLVRLEKEQDFVEKELYPLFYMDIFPHHESRFHKFAWNTIVTYGIKTGQFNKVKFLEDLEEIKYFLSRVSIKELTEEARKNYSNLKNVEGGNLDKWMTSIHKSVNNKTYFGVQSHKMDVLTRAIDHFNQINYGHDESSLKEIPPFDPDQFGSGLKVA